MSFRRLQIDEEDAAASWDAVEMLASQNMQPSDMPSDLQTNNLFINLELEDPHFSDIQYPYPSRDNFVNEELVRAAQREELRELSQPNPTDSSGVNQINTIFSPHQSEQSGPIYWPEWMTASPSVSEFVSHESPAQPVSFAGIRSGSGIGTQPCSFAQINSLRSTSIQHTYIWSKLGHSYPTSLNGPGYREEFGPARDQLHSSVLHSRIRLSSAVEKESTFQFFPDQADQNHSPLLFPSRIALLNLGCGDTSVACENKEPFHVFQDDQQISLNYSTNPQQDSGGDCQVPFELTSWDGSDVQFAELCNLGAWSVWNGGFGCFNTDWMLQNMNDRRTCTEHMDCELSDDAALPLIPVHGPNESEVSMTPGDTCPVAASDQ
ncbi:uncharacterized protein PV09_05641 [Verruconis gallopava]|uniref:Uncharacterized protein n=1 Tax=Verruconis gallopava TaxID=253628 RepID=A0A0D2A8V0_9PEZI|nr:uncharacterized protein PV09_05641 [Verruconis gallopava]KIW02980.1 hypothetical protein PV09_05641 [Verruconis gallopava]